DQGIGQPGFGKTTGPKQTTVTPSARAPVRQRVVTAVRQTVIDSEFRPQSDDTRLRQILEGGPDLKRPFVDTGPGRQGREILEGGNEVRTAIGIARIVEGVDTDDDALGSEDLGPAKRQRQQDRVARRYVGRRNAGRNLTGL